LERRDLSLGAFRLLVRFSLLASIALVVLGLYEVLPAQNHPWVGLATIVAGVILLLPSQAFRIRPEPGAENQLILLGKPDCSLCDEAREVLRVAIVGTPFQIQEIDIQDHPRLRRRFKDAIPVLFHQGDEVARLRIGLDPIRAYLAAQLASRRPTAPGPSAT
jgi:hypothetical protein